MPETEGELLRRVAARVRGDTTLEREPQVIPFEPFDSVSEAEQALAMVEIVAAADDPWVGCPPPARDLSKPPDNAPGWVRRAGRWERWEDADPGCEHRRTEVMQSVEHCLDCTGMLEQHEDVTEENGAAVFAIRGTPIHGAMPFERLTIASEQRQGVLGSPHEQGEAEVAQLVAAARSGRSSAHLGVFAGDAGVFSDGEARTLEQAESVMAGLEQQPANRFDRLPKLLQAMPSWKVLLKAPWHLLSLLESDFGLMSRWSRSVDQEELLSLLEQTPLAALRDAPRSADYESEWPARRVEAHRDVRRACDALTWIWVEAHAVVYVNESEEIRRAYDKRLDEEAVALLAALQHPTLCVQALKGFELAGRFVRTKMMEALGDAAAWSRPNMRTYHCLLGIVVMAHVQARVGSSISGDLGDEWLAELEDARQHGRVDEAVQTILTHGEQEAFLLVQPADIATVLDLEALTSTSPITSPLLLNRHCYPWWLSTVQKALREHMAAHANGASETAQA